jgi:hypothetical protein
LEADNAAARRGSITSVTSIVSVDMWTTPVVEGYRDNLLFLESEKAPLGEPFTITTLA